MVIVLIPRLTTLLKNCQSIRPIFCYNLPCLCRVEAKQRISSAMMMVGMSGLKCVEDCNLIIGSQRRSCFSGATSFWNWSSRMLLNCSLQLSEQVKLWPFKGGLNMMSLNLEFGPAVFPLKVYPHHNSKLHVCHHHVLKAMEECL